MADSMADGNTRVAFLTACAVITAPTTTELNAGVLCNSRITPDGLIGWEATTADAPTGALDSMFDTNENGRDSMSGPTFRVKKQTGTDSVFLAIGTRDTRGFVVIRRDVAATTAWTSGQAVEVYPVVTSRRRNLAPESNSVRKYEVPFKVTSTPAFDAVIA